METKIKTSDPQRLSQLAESIDCFTEEDFLLLGEIKPSTAEAWRKRGGGPAYVLLGNRYLYPKTAVKAFVQSLVRERTQVPAKACL